MTAYMQMRLLDIYSFQPYAKQLNDLVITFERQSKRTNKC